MNKPRSIKGMRGSAPSQATLDAIEEIQNNGISIRAAAIKYGLNYGGLTRQCKKHGIVTDKCAPVEICPMCGQRKAIDAES